MKGISALLFLIVSYNFLLWYITASGLSPVELFPGDPYHVLLVLSCNSVLFISWLFGERHKTVLWIGYLFLFQIIALSIYFEDPSIVIMDLVPVVLTFALVVLFESPMERKIKSISRERERLMAEIQKVMKEREEVENHLKELRGEIERLEREKKAADLEIKHELEARIRELQDELREYREKERRLLETNRKLFHLLEMVKGESHEVGAKEELTSLRRERKKLIRELISLQELLDVYTDEAERLREENASLKEEIGRIRLELEKATVSYEESRKSDVRSLFGEVVEAVLNIRFSERAVEELLSLTPEKRKLFLRELMRLSMGDKASPKPLRTLHGVYKLRLSGGRIYLKKAGRSWEVVGVLGSEESKDKERYIREVLRGRV